MGDTTKIIQLRESNTKRPKGDLARYRTPSPARRRQASGPLYQIDVRDLPPDMTWSELKDIARTFGESVAFANVFVKSGITCGVIEYRDRREATYAVKELDGRRVDGHSQRLQAFQN